MPWIESSFSRPWWLPNGHLETLWPFLSRRLTLNGQPVSIPLADGDRLLADYYPAPPGLTGPGAGRLMIIAHGLEGHSRRPYVLGLARKALAQGYGVLAWNFRSCGPESNLLPRFYHAGCSHDLDAVIEWSASLPYAERVLTGFSMGGNITLKWLGEAGDTASGKGVVAAAVLSVPCDLTGCTDSLESPQNALYRRRFVTDLSARLRRKAEEFPDTFDLRPLSGIRTVREFDDLYTAPMHGFKNAADYYHQCSASRFLGAIRVPTLLLNARNDPFLSPSCYPEAVSRQHAWLHLEAPRHGGHVGFYAGRGQWWADTRLCEFLNTGLSV